MAITEWYVSTDGNDATGDGTAWATAWRTPEYALDTGIPATGQGANGDRLNIRGSHTLTKALSSCTYFSSYTPSSTKPVYFKGEGHASSILDGDASYSIFASTSIDYVGFGWLTLRNCGANHILQFDNYSAVVGCVLHGTSGQWIDLDLYGTIADCRFYDCSGSIGITIDSSSEIFGCYCDGTTNAPSSTVINMTGVGAAAIGNVVRLKTGQNATVVSCGNNGQLVHNNSIFAVASTGVGISIGATATVVGNLVEGFSGLGGVGIAKTAANWAPVANNNAVYNCTTAYTDITETGAIAWLSASDNETLSASPFTDAANGDFTPIDTGNVKDGGLPDFALWLPTHRSYLWKGAIQPAASASSTSKGYIIGG